MQFGLQGPLNPRLLGLARALDACGDDTAIASTTTLTDTPPAAFDLGGTVEFAYDDGPQQSRVLRFGDARVVLTWWGGPELEIEALAPTIDEAEALLAKALSQAVPLTQRDDSVYVTFWSLTAMGPQSRRRPLEAGVWSEMAFNYPSAARAALEDLMGWETAPGLGQLLLLYGPPGTGKTTAIRALAQAWRGWADLHYVVDPEEFFGHASYMLSVLLDGTDDYDADGNESKRWQLVVVEDTDELITADAKSRSGQAMSRLLNVCDGLIGQGLRVLVLLTTNEPFDTLHPAVTRPGRCAARIEAGLFPPAEARAWLRAHEITEAPEDDCSLADLYRLLHERSLTASARPIGFG